MTWPNCRRVNFIRREVAFIDCRHASGCLAGVQSSRRHVIVRSAERKGPTRRQGGDGIRVAPIERRRRGPRHLAQHQEIPARAHRSRFACPLPRAALHRREQCRAPNFPRFFPLKPPPWRWEHITCAEGAAAAQSAAHRDSRRPKAFDRGMLAGGPVSPHPSPNVEVVAENAACCVDRSARARPPRRCGRPHVCSISGPKARRLMFWVATTPAAGRACAQRPPLRGY